MTTYKKSIKNRVNPCKTRKRLRKFFLKHDKSQLFFLFTDIPLSRNKIKNYKIRNHEKHQNHSGITQFRNYWLP